MKKIYQKANEKTNDELREISATHRTSISFMYIYKETKKKEIEKKLNKNLDEYK